MWHFSGIKFAACLAYETHNPLPSHEIRRKRTRRQNFSLDAQEENHPFSHCRYSYSFRSPLTVTSRFSHHTLDLSMRDPHDVSSSPTALCMEMRHGTDRPSDTRKPNHHRRFPR